jgi:hypothetical protein
MKVIKGKIAAKEFFGIGSNERIEKGMARLGYRLIADNTPLLAKKNSCC